MRRTEQDATMTESYMRGQHVNFVCFGGEEGYGLFGSCEFMIVFRHAHLACNLASTKYLNTTMK
eukprot:m.224120 g.224120  ORF g.224120 m.224120 type:complete len:64 (+) comp15146_c0_seq7:1664-1855(+)